MSIVTDVETRVKGWFSGMLTDVEKFNTVVAPVVQKDLTPILANVHTEFVSAEGTFMQAEYEAFKSIVAASVKEAEAKGGSLGTIASEAFAIALPALKSGGMRVAESVILQVVVSALGAGAI